MTSPIDFGHKISAREFEARVVHGRKTLTNEEYDRAECDAMIDRQLGVNFPKERRSEVFAALKKGRVRAGIAGVAASAAHTLLPPGRIQDATQSLMLTLLQRSLGNALSKDEAAAFFSEFATSPTSEDASDHGQRRPPTP